jgi:TusA-related sulfurtransferase
VQYPFSSGKEENDHGEVSADYFLDITTQVCPLTFVRTKLFIERMACGETLEIRLNAGEPLENIPRSLAELGATVLSLAPERTNEPDGVHRMVVRWNGRTR